MSSIQEANHVGADGHGLHIGPIFDATKDKFSQPSWGDIIPRFTYPNPDDPEHPVTFPGLNWTTEGQAILENGCEMTPPPPTPEFDLSLTCTAWSVDLAKYVTGREVVVQIDDMTPITGTIDRDGSYTGGGTLNLGAGDHSMVVTVGGTQVGTTQRVDSCTGPPTPTADVSLTCSAWSATFTDFDLQSLYRVTVDDVTVGTGVISTSPVTVGDVDSFTDGMHTVRAYVSDELVRTEEITLTCTAPTLYAGTAAYPKVSVCYGADVIEVGPIATPYGTAKIYASQADADAAAAAYVNANTEGAKVGFMAAHPEYAPVPADGICIPPTEPEPVAVVQPATVAAVQPATVPVPAHVTLPARIPAGEGPTVPTYVLALLVLGATALAASTVHLVRTTR